MLRAQVSSGCPIGLCDVSHTDDDIIKCVHRADEALYQAKQTGRNCFMIGGSAPEKKSQ